RRQRRPSQCHRAAPKTRWPPPAACPSFARHVLNVQALTVRKPIVAVRAFPARARGATVHQLNRQLGSWTREARTTGDGPDGVITPATRTLIRPTAAYVRAP